MTLRGREVGVNVPGRWLIRDIDVEVVPGEVLVVLGPNGAGKSTLLSALAGDRGVDAGSVAFGDEPIEAISLESLADRRAVIGAPAQLAFDFTVRDIVEMGWRGDGRYDAATRDAASAEVMAESDVDSLASRIYMTLSSGEQQRVQFARGLLQVWRANGDEAPRWLLLDEPTSNLDIANGIALLERLRAHAGRGLGVLAILHDLNLGARFADRVLLLDGGRTAACGTPAEVMTAERLSAVYGTDVHVEHHAALDRLVVLT